MVTPEQCRDIIGRDPEIVHYPMPDGSIKLAAGWLIDACGWKGKSVGRAGVYEKQALVLVNRGGAIGAEVLTLARAIQESVYGRFGIRLEPEPVLTTVLPQARTASGTGLPGQVRSTPGRAGAARRPGLR